MSSSKQGTPGIVIGGFICAFLCPIVGIILCAIGLGEAKKRNAGVGLAQAGLVIAIVNMVVGVYLKVTGTF